MFQNSMLPKLTLILPLYLFCFSVISANIIGNVEYELPKLDHGWKLSQNETKKEKDYTLVSMIYIPDNTTEEEAAEYFGATSNNSPGSAHNIQSLKNLLQQQFPDHQINITILDKNQDSTLYEWHVKEGEEDKVVGWSRIFSTQQGTTTLGYLTDQTEDIQKVRPIWIKTFKEAKLIK